MPTQLQMNQAAGEYIVEQAQIVGEGARWPKNAAAAQVLRVAYARAIAQMIGRGASPERFTSVDHDLRLQLRADIVLQHFLLYGKRDS